MSKIKRLIKRKNSIKIVIGGICMELLANFNVKIISRVVKTENIEKTKAIGYKIVSEYEKVNTCVLSALGVICKNILTFEIVKDFLQKFSGDCIEDIKNSYDFYISRIVRG